jgi:hypothetical protein
MKPKFRENEVQNLSSYLKDKKNASSLQETKEIIAFYSENRINI